ncbi:hypothetical protein [Psychrobacter sp. AOP31-E1-50]|uniref:hypothetical protein n=1 Tax=Psychrobacter sp. AOP31-E1-50 TaxID=3457692 RepID=UPI003FDB873A
MSEAKALPDNIKAFEQSPEFKKVYDNNTVDKLEMQLIEADVEFLSADNKAALVWRLLDHQGTLESDNDTETKDDTKEAVNGAQTTDSSADDDVSVDAATGGNGGSDSDTSNSNESVTSINKGDSNENAQTAQDDTSDEHGAQVNGEANADTISDSASTDDSEKSNGVADAADSDAPSNTGNSNDISADEANQPAKTGDKAATNSSVPTDKAPTKTAVSELEYVEVKNNGGFNMLEPATGTLVTAGKITKIYIKGYATKDQVLRNIAQYNHTRGEKLTVTN